MGIGFRIGLQPFLFQSGQDEMINGVARPISGFDGGHRGAGRGHISPVLRIRASLADPLFEGGSIGGRQGFAGIRRRHLIIRILGLDAPDGFALFGVAGNNRRMAVSASVGRLGQVQTQGFLAGFAATGVGSMALETVLGKNPANIPVELEVRRGRTQPHGRHQAGDDEAKAPPASAFWSRNS